MGLAAHLELLGFGPNGWGAQLAWGAWMTLAVSVCAFAAGLVFGTLGAWAKIAGGIAVRAAADTYTTVLRGIPDLLVIYLFYFGGSQAITAIGHALGHEGFLGINAFTVGVLAVGIVSGAYQTETLRGAFAVVPRGEIEAARAVGMGRWLMLRRIIAPRVLRFALPGMGNVWQLVLKESALISVTGLAELMRQSSVAARSSRAPFDFYIAAFLIYLCLTSVSGTLFRAAELHTMRPERR